MRADPKSLAEGQRYMLQLKQLGPNDPLNNTVHALEARIAHKMRSITVIIKPAPGYIPTGFASEAEHQAEYARNEPLRQQRMKETREATEKRYAKLHPRSTPLATRRARAKPDPEVERIWARIKRAT